MHKWKVRRLHLCTKLICYGDPSRWSYLIIELQAIYLCNTDCAWSSKMIVFCCCCCKDIWHFLKYLMWRLFWKVLYSIYNYTYEYCHFLLLCVNQMWQHAEGGGMDLYGDHIPDIGRFLSLSLDICWKRSLKKLRGQQFCEKWRERKKR